MNPIRFTVCCWIGFWLYWAVKATKTKRTIAFSQDGRTRIISKAGLALMFCFFYVPVPIHWTLASRLIPPAVWVNVLGCAMCSLGVAVAIWSRHLLGENWSGAITLKENHTLIQSGPYSTVRHPIYAGMMFAMLGTALVVGEVKAILALCGFFWLFKKMKQEELLMRIAFPSEYPDYQRHVKKLIPGIW